MNKRYIIIILIFLLVLLLLIIIYRKIEYQNYKDNIYLELAIYSGSYSSTYYFVITKDKVMHVSFGRRERDELGSIPYLRSINEKGEKMLSEQEFQKIEEIISSLDDAKNEKRFTSDIFRIRAYYQQKEYLADYDYGTNEELIELAGEIIDLSPIPIVLRSGRQEYIEKQNHYL